MKTPGDYVRQENRVCARGIHRLRLQSNIEHQTDVADLVASKVFEYGYQVEEFVIVGVREPAADRDGMLRVEDVRGGRVVDNDSVLEIATDLREILVAVSRA